jgi:hypothetical protein
MRSNDRVPVEWIGRARQLRTRCAAGWNAAEPEMTKLLAPLRPRPGFLPQPTHRYLRRVALAWRDLPSAGRLRLRCSFEKGVLRITELRAIPMRITSAAWTEAEPAIAIALIAVTVAPPTLTEHPVVLASVGMHAIARRYERGSRDDGSVLDDLLELARDVVGGQNADITVPTADGCWVCRRYADNSLVARTFLAEPQVAAA